MTTKNAPITTDVMTYTYHEDAGWHEFIFHRADNSAVDAVNVYLEAFYQRPASEKIRVLFDNTKTGGLPLIYSYQTVSKLLARYPKRPHIRHAFLSDNRIDLMRMVRGAVMALNPNTDSNYFGAGQRNAALMWLLRD